MPTPAGPEPSTKIEVSTSGRLLFGFLNYEFVFSLLGGLQALTAVLGLLVTSLLGASTSYSTSNTSAMGGFTFYVIVLLVSFWCLLTTGFIYISCAVSQITAVLLPKTIFFLLYNAMAAVFYLICAITCLGEASTWRWIWAGSDVRSMVIAASVIGIAAGAAYILITVVAVFMYRKGRVS